MTELRRRIARGVAWTGLGASAVGALDLVALFLLLRYWVSPRELGVATLAVALFPVLDLLADLGLGAALVQGEPPGETRRSTVFWLSLAVTTLLVALLVMAGPAVAHFHGEPAVAGLLAAYGAKLLLQCLWSVPLAHLRRELRFRELSLVRMAANTADATTKIAVAAAGFPIWCFVAGPLAYGAVFAAGVQLCHPWRPQLRFSRAEAASCLRFGLRTSGSQILFHFSSNLDYQVVGRVFGETALGLYRVAVDLVLYTVRFLGDVVVSVAFPAFARLRGQAAELSAQFVRLSRQSLVLNLPALAAVLVAADDLLAVFFPKYAGAATAARLLCAVGLLRALAATFPPLLDGMGRPGQTLLYAGAFAIVMPALFVAAAAMGGERFGFSAVAGGWAVGYPIVFALLAALGLGALGMRARTYLAGVGGVAACALAAVAAGLGVRVAAAPLAPPQRLVLEVGATLAVLAVLLGRWQGMGLRAVWRALRS